jgi:hypothetical protein
MFGMDQVVFLPDSYHMPNVCILADGTIQFMQSNFPGHEQVHT